MALLLRLLLPAYAIISYFTNDLTALAFYRNNDLFVSLFIAQPCYKAFLNKTAEVSLRYPISAVITFAIHAL